MAAKRETFCIVCSSALAAVLMLRRSSTCAPTARASSSRTSTCSSGCTAFMSMRRNAGRAPRRRWCRMWRTGHDEVRAAPAGVVVRRPAEFAQGLPAPLLQSSRDLQSSRCRKHGCLDRLEFDVHYSDVQTSKCTIQIDWSTSRSKQADVLQIRLETVPPWLPRGRTSASACRCATRSRAQAPRRRLLSLCVHAAGPPAKLVVAVAPWWGLVSKEINESRRS